MALDQTEGKDYLLTRSSTKEIRMFKDEFEQHDPTKIPFATKEEEEEFTIYDPFGDGLDPEERKWEIPKPDPLLEVSDSAKFSAAAQ